MEIDAPSPYMFSEAPSGRPNFYFMNILTYLFLKALRNYYDNRSTGFLHAKRYFRWLLESGPLAPSQRGQ